MVAPVEEALCSDDFRMFPKHFHFMNLLESDAA